MSGDQLTKLRKTRVHRVIIEQMDGRSMQRLRKEWGEGRAPRSRPEAIRRWLLDDPRADLTTLSRFLRIPQLRAAAEAVGYETEGLLRCDLICTLIKETGLEIIERWPRSKDAAFFRRLLRDEGESDGASPAADADDSDIPLPHEVVLRRAIEARGADPEMPIPHLLRRIHSWTPESLETVVKDACAMARKVRKPMCEWFLLRALESRGCSFLEH
ncbi:MAG: hypothetical protein ABIK09_19710 [Pseudomonadota bacterium]